MKYDLLKPMSPESVNKRRAKVPATPQNTIDAATFAEQYPQSDYYKQLIGVLFRGTKSRQQRSATIRDFEERGLRVERESRLGWVDKVTRTARAHRRLTTATHAGVAVVATITTLVALDQLGKVVDLKMPGGGSDQTAEGAAPAQGNQSPNTTETTLVFAPAPQSETGSAPTPSPESTTPAPDFTFKSTAGAGSVACTGAFVIVTIDRGSSTGPLRQMQEATGASWAEGNPAGDALLYEELLAHPANAEFVAGATSDLAVPGNCSGLER